MLSDLLTSSKGPGVVGTVLALIVLLGFGGLLLLVGIESPGSGLGVQIKDKEKKINDLTGSMQHWKEAAVEYRKNREEVEKLEGVNAKIKRRKGYVELAKSDNDAIRAEIEELRKKFEDYKKQYRIAERARAVGEEMDTLTTKSGKVYHQVKIKNVTALEMRFSHRDGNTGVSYKELPDELQDRFQFSETDAQVMQEKEQAKVQRSVQGGERYKVTRKILDKKNKIRQNNEYITQWTSEIERKKSEIISNEAAAKAADKSAQHYRSLYDQGRRGMTLDHAKKAERKAARCRNNVTRARARISSNHQKIRNLRREIKSLQKEIAQLEKELAKLKITK